MKKKKKKSWSMGHAQANGQQNEVNEVGEREKRESRNL